MEGGSGEGVLPGPYCSLCLLSESGMLGTPTAILPPARETMRVWEQEEEGLTP